MDKRTKIENANWQEYLKNDVFQVPEGYFDDFRERMVKQVTTNPVKTVTLRKRKPVLYWLSGVAAALLIGVIGLHQYVIKPHEDQKEMNAMLELMAYYNADLDDITMVTVLADNEVFDLEANDSYGNLLDYFKIDEVDIIENWMNSDN